MMGEVGHLWLISAIVRDLMISTGQIRVRDVFGIEYPRQRLLARLVGTPVSRHARDVICM